jgi:hypothetical protein
MKLTLALTLLSVMSATHARVNVFYSDGKQSFPELGQQDRPADLGCSKPGTQYRLGNDGCRDYAGMKAVYFSKVKKWRKVCLHRFRQDGCMDAGAPVTIQLGGGQSEPFPWEPELISDSIKYFQCEPIEGDWRSYYISQVCQATHCV